MATRKQWIKNVMAVVLLLSPVLVPCQKSFASDEMPTKDSSTKGTQPADQETAKDKELKRLQSILVTLNQELEATYHQFQMIQEARRGIVQSMFDPRPGLDPRSYDELVKERERAVEQERELSNQMNQLLDKARAIETKMNPILDRVYQLIPDPGSYQQNQEESPTPDKQSRIFKIKPIPY